jgi:hypothetical protein
VTHRILSLLVMSLMVGRVVAHPGEALAAALAHARSLPPDPARQLRYLDLSHLPEEQLYPAFQVLCFHINSLSRESNLVRPRMLEGGKLLAIDLRDFGLDPAVYGRLATADTYFHVQLEYTDPKSGRKDRRPAVPPWLNGADYAELIRLTNTQTPILRGDWFLAQTCAQKDRVAGYYDLLGLGKKEADFQRLIGANPAEAKRLRLETAASVATSTVALHNRGIFRQQSLTGGHWVTLDFKTSTDRQNTARLLAGDTEPPQGDASEQYGVLPNRLFAYWLQDAKGNRQDTAPDDIASDGKSTSTDRRVHVCLSCVRCHAGGLQPVDDFARNLFRGPLQLVSPDYDKLKRLRQLYLSDLPGQIGDDNNRYAGAVDAVNGLTPPENSRYYAAMFEAFFDTPLAPAVMARELGCTEAGLLRAVKAYVAATPVADPVVAAYAQEPPLAIRRDHALEVYAKFQEILVTFGGRSP